MLTMRLFAEEKKSGTIELLLTYPLRDGEVLAGKYLAALRPLRDPPRPDARSIPASSRTSPASSGAPILTGLPRASSSSGAAFLAIGVLVSSPDREPDRGGLRHLRRPARRSGSSAGARSSAGGTLRTVLQYLSITEHIDTFSRGVIDTKDLVYYLTGDRARAVPHPALARVEAVAGLGR